jgi:hypothetical protein
LKPQVALLVIFANSSVNDQITNLPPPAGVAAVDVVPPFFGQPLNRIRAIPVMRRSFFILFPPND